MALKDDILARKLAKPRRQPRPGPIIDADGAVHYRVFDEPIAKPLIELDNLNTNVLEATLAPTLVLETPETEIVIETPKIRSEKTLPIEPPISKPEGERTISLEEAPLKKGISFLSALDTVDPLSAELMISGIALDILRVLATFVQDVSSGVTTPVMFETLHASSGINKGSLRKTIQRLEKKGVIERVKFKDGIGGWTQYRICNYQNLMGILKNRT